MGTSFDHNGSDVIVCEKAGVVVYDHPKPSLAGVVHAGDVIFSGRITGREVVGIAYAFKVGRGAAPYAVRGRYILEGYGGRNELTLAGASTIPTRRSRDVTGYTLASSNAPPRFAYASDLGK
jgi:hypothetical protein